ncbi:MAG: methylmalonyl-CoA epimerase [Acidobacteriota bacterium]|nr:methylmalonyl-CoA epimerase [Acidobacteriota bacterium]
MKLDHIGIAVHSIDKALRSYRVAMGLEMEGAIDVEEQKVRVAMLPVGESRIELLEATDPTSPICRFLANRGEGVHHICFKVRDLDQKLSAFRKAGIQILSDADGTGYEGRRIAFLHPRSTHGVLIELVEE